MSPKILAVEDDSDLQFLYSTLLERHGYEVVTAENTVQAMLHLTNDEFNLILLDMNMPDVPGIRVIEFTHEDVRLRHIPIVVVSANDLWESKVMALGVEHFMVKPITLQQLLDRIALVLSA